MRRRRWRIAGDMYGSRLGGWEFTIIFARVRTTDCEMKFCSRNFHGELYSRSISSRDKNNREDPGAARNLCRARGSLFFFFFFLFFTRPKSTRIIFSEGEFLSRVTELLNIGNDRDVGKPILRNRLPKIGKGNFLMVLIWFNPLNSG